MRIFAVPGVSLEVERLSELTSRIERVSRVTLGSEKSRCARSGTIAFYRAGSPIFSFSLSIPYSHASRFSCLSALRPPYRLEMNLRRALWRSARSQHPLSATDRLVPFLPRVYGSSLSLSLFSSPSYLPLALTLAMYTVFQIFPAHARSSTRTRRFVLPPRGTNLDVVSPLAEISLSVMRSHERAPRRSTFECVRN